MLAVGNGVYRTVRTASQLIVPADVTGRIHFRLSHDDATDGIVQATARTTPSARCRWLLR